MNELARCNSRTGACMHVHIEGSMYELTHTMFPTWIKDITRCTEAVMRSISVFTCSSATWVSNTAFVDICMCAILSYY